MFKNNTKQKTFSITDYLWSNKNLRCKSKIFGQILTVPLTVAVYVKDFELRNRDLQTMLHLLIKKANFSHECCSIAA